MNLLEAYSKRLKVSESVYSRSHEGAGLDNRKKIAIAQCLKNTNAFLNEAFANSTGTQQADMGLWKKFCLNLVTVALPNLIGPELVMTHAMTSMSGNVAYIKYTSGTTKGQTTAGTTFNDPFRLGTVDSTYTSSAVTETFATGQTVLMWTPVVQSTFTVTSTVTADIKILTGSTVKYGTFADASSAKSGTLTGMTFVDTSGSSISHTFTAGDKIAYCYDNVVIPQNDIPVLNAQMDNIPLLAKARRIAIYYSQMAAFQAKTDYGFDLGDQLAEKAVGQLQYEIDTEIVELLTNNAATNSKLNWSKTQPVGVSKRDHYAGFAEILEVGKQLIYDATKKFTPNYMIISSSVLPILTFIDGFKPAKQTSVNGPYKAGTINGLNVYVSPSLAPSSTDTKIGSYVLGVNGSDFMSSAAVYAPYMPIVPTQLLTYADGGSSQGFSTLYDLKILNADLLVKGDILA